MLSSRNLQMASLIKMQIIVNGFIAKLNYSE